VVREYANGNHRAAGTGVNPAHDRFDGIILQEWSAPDRGLFRPVKNIYSGHRIAV